MRSNAQRDALAIQRIAPEITLHFFPKLLPQFPGNGSSLARLQQRPLARVQKPMLAAIPGARSFNHIGKIVRARLRLDIEKAQESKRAFLVVGKIFKIEDRLPRPLQPVKFQDVVRVSAEPAQPFAELDVHAPEVVRSEAVERIAQEQGHPLID